MSRLAPAITHKDEVKRTATKDHACDRCGVSEGGGHVAVAKFEVQTPSGSIFLCGSHLRRHFAHILEKDYDVVPTGA